MSTLLDLVNYTSSQERSSDLQALIYEDMGVNAHSVEATVQQLSKILDPAISIRKVDSRYLVTQAWEDKTVVLILGGGTCSEWDGQLGERGIDKIREYVFQGGKYIGFCAGAYFASSESCFKQTNQPSIERKRSLAFFEGKAIGPILPTEDYRSPEAAQAAKISFTIRDKIQDGFLYYQGGCYFDIEQDSSQTKIVSRFQDLTFDQVAAVSCRVNKGSAFLCGMHPEFAWSKSLQKVPHPVVSRLANTLCSQEKFRHQIWREIGRTLHLPMKKKRHYGYAPDLSVEA